MKISDLDNISIRLRKNLYQQVDNGEVSITISSEDDRSLVAEFKELHPHKPYPPETLDGGTYRGVKIWVVPR